MRIAVGIDGTVFLDGEPVGRAKAHALDGRPLAAIAPGTIPPGHFFLHADHRDSHDSRYAEIGLVPRGRILGRAIAMPDIPWLGLKGPLVGPEDAGRPDGPATILPYPQDGPPPARGPAQALRRRRRSAVRSAVESQAVMAPDTCHAFRPFVAAVLAAALAPPQPAAKDLGVRGATWPVAEPDLLAEIEARLVELERSGELARLETQARERARMKLEEPDPVPGIAPAAEERSRLFDPAITVARDIRTSDGTLIAAAGTRVNPLDRTVLARDLLFVDGLARGRNRLGARS